MMETRATLPSRSRKDPSSLPPRYTVWQMCGESFHRAALDVASSFSCFSDGMSFTAEVTS